MLERKLLKTIGAYEAKTKFSELIARAEQGESFLVTRNGKPVAEIRPALISNRETARRAGERMLARIDRAPKVSEQAAQREWEELRRDLERDRDERIAR